MRQLPVRYPPTPGQALDDWLEHLATDNAMTPAHMCSILRSHGGTTRFLTVTLTPPTAGALAALTGTAPAATYDATLAHYQGTGILDLSGLDPSHWSTWRRVAARGWVRARGSAACPRCLEEDRIWRLAWRLPATTTCIRHAAHLVEACPRCHRPLLDHPHTPLRRTAGTRCLNPADTRAGCQYDLRDAPAPTASLADFARQRRHDAAIEHHHVSVLGESVPGHEYLTDVQALTVLLLHLAADRRAEAIATWAPAVRAESGEETRRWHLSPPSDPGTRSQVLVMADAILTAPDLDTAATALQPWLDLVPAGPESRLGWIADRTHPTPRLTRLLMTTLAPHRRISHALSTVRRRIDPRTIPQVLPPALFETGAARHFSSGPETARRFLSLCLARLAGADTWASAAELLGLDPADGVRVARAATARTRIDPARLLPVLENLATQLSVDYHAREDTVIGLARSSAWFDEWALEQRPGTRPTSKRYAVTWIWVHWAHALMTQSPAWPCPPDRAQRAAYRQFAASLRDQAADALVATAHHALEENK